MTHQADEQNEEPDNENIKFFNIGYRKGRADEHISERAEYKIIMNTDLQKFLRELNQYLSEKWSLYGDLKLMNGRGNFSGYFQAVTRGIDLRLDTRLATLNQEGEKRLSE